MPLIAVLGMYITGLLKENFNLRYEIEVFSTLTVQILPLNTRTVYSISIVGHS